MIYKRSIIDKVIQNINNEYILVIIGARQVGKTTVLRILYNDLKDKKNNCYFINLEKLDYVSLLNQDPLNIFKIIPEPKERIFVFIDEIQYLSNPTNFLKYIYDEYKEKIKLIISGSSAFYIDKKFKDSLAGRKRIFDLYSLSFKEFLIFKNKEELKEYLPEKIDDETCSKLEKIPILIKNELLLLFSEYIRYGGYPALVLAEDPVEKVNILEDLVNSTVKKDILESNLKYSEKYYNLLKLFSSQCGGLINKYELSKTLMISVNAIDNYLYIMQKSFQIALINSYHKNIRKEIIKMPKIFFYDLGIRNYLFNDFQDINLRFDKGILLENVVFKQLLDKFSLDKINFWRTQDKNEIDFVIDDKYAFEVKYNAQTFNYSKYKIFRENYKDIQLNLITFSELYKKTEYKILPAWGI